MNRAAKGVACIFWIIATGLYLTAMLTNYWISTASSNYNYGVFYFCELGQCGFVEWTPTNNLVRNNLFITIPRIIMLAGAALIVLGTLIGLIGYCSRSNCPVMTEGIFGIIGGVVIMGACATFTAMNFPREGSYVESALQSFFGISQYFQKNFHYSFYFGWVSGFLYVVSGICSIAAGNSDKY